MSNEAFSSLLNDVVFINIVDALKVVFTLFSL